MTIRELAARLRLSKSTVAYALRDAPAVKPATRELVQRRARELGYSPNPVASAFLQHVRSQGSLRYQATLAFLFTLPASSLPAGSAWPTSGYQRYIYDGVDARARELGYVIDRINTKDFKAARLSQILAARGVLGIILGPLFRPVGHVMLDWSKFSAVSYGYSMVRPAVHRVVHNHLQGMRTAFRMLRREGHDRIGLILGDEADKRSNSLWSCGFLGLQQTLPKPRRLRPLLAPTTQMTPGAVRDWLRKEKPDAVICHNAQTVPRLPEFSRGKIACALLDRLPRDPHPGIDQQFGRAGSLLVDLLAAQILHNQRGLPASPVVSMVDGIWSTPATAS
jgi:LacI family transcriptional regulator